MGSESQLSEAKDLLERAWSLRDNAPPIKYMLANNIAVLYLYLGNIHETDKWLDRSETQMSITQMSDRDKKRSYARLKYYIAEKYYRLRQYDLAEEFFKEVLEDSQKIDWLRFVSGSKEWLSAIAIKKGYLWQAEKLINEGYPIAKRNHDMRRLAFYQRGYARLKKEQKKYVEALDWAKKSLETFERLKIEKRIQEIRDLILELENISAP